MTQYQDVGSRESTFKVWVGSITLVTGRGCLEDTESINVSLQIMSHAYLLICFCANMSVSQHYFALDIIWLAATHTITITSVSDARYPPVTAPSPLPQVFIHPTTPNLTLFQSPLLNFLLALIFPRLTPTVAKLFPTGDDTNEDSMATKRRRMLERLPWCL